MMRFLYAYTFFVLTAAGTVASAQYGPYPSSGEVDSPYDNQYTPYNNFPSSNGNSPPAGIRSAQAPDNSDYTRYQEPRGGRWGAAGNSEAPMRSSAFRPERAASYMPANEVPYQQTPRGGHQPPPGAWPPAADPWGPPPDIRSIAPEGRRNPLPAQPRRGDPPPSGHVQTDPAPNDPPPNDPAPGDPGPVPENELFEPNPDDLRGAIWYQPSTWEDIGWETTIELGLNGSSGNSRTNSLKAGGKVERETDRNKFLFELVHNRAATDDISIQNNAIGKTRYDHKFGESRWSWFSQGYGEYDEFKDFDLRLAGNSGVNYKFIKTDTTTLSGDFGSGVSHELGGPDDSYVPEAVFGLDFKHKLSSRQQFYVKTEYFPDWGDFASYRVVTDFGWELLLDEEWGLNLKIGVLDRYDSTPGTRKPNDLNYSMLLLWKL